MFTKNNAYRPEHRGLTMALTDSEKSRRKMLAARIKIARKSAGFPDTRSFVVKFFPKMPEDTFYKFESARAAPDDNILKKISQVTQVNFDWLKNGNGDMFEDIEIDSSESENKAAIAGYELLTLKFREQLKETSSSPLKQMLAQYRNQIAHNQQNLAPLKTDEKINEKLLEDILSELIKSLSTKTKQINEKTLAQLSSKIYSKIIESTNDQTLQQQMVKPVIAASEWSFEKELTVNK